MNKSRLEAFSDGVIAVAITLLVIDLHVPAPEPGSDLGRELAQQWPSYVAYVVSFLTIGIIWINHHAMLRRLTQVDRSILSLNVLLLMSIVVLPFTTALMAEYVDRPEGARVAGFVYGASLLLMGVLFVGLQAHLVFHRSELLRDDVTPQVRQQILRRNAVGIAPYAIATVGALITPYITLIISAVLAVYFALPFASPDDSLVGD